MPKAMEPCHDTSKMLLNMCDSEMKPLINQNYVILSGILQTYTGDRSMFNVDTAHLMMKTYKISLILRKYEPPHGKTNNVVFDQVLHKPDCTVTEDS